MKKLMMVIAALAVFGSVKAASVNWTFSATGTTFGGYEVYLTSVASGFNSVADIEAKELGTGASGTLVAGSRTSSVNGVISGLDETKEYPYYFVVVNSTTGDYWVSSAQSVTTAAETAAAASTAYTAANGKTLLTGTPTGKFSSVPEPTSGLLLLLGMAGLALKRKVA